MDPVSVTASVITLASLATKLCSTFAEIRTNCSALPGRLHALSNEVSDLRAVLFEVACALEERSSLCSINDIQIQIHSQLDQGTHKLSQLGAALARLQQDCTAKRGLIFVGVFWKREQAQLKTLQDDIKTIKSSLNLLIGTSHSRDMMQVCMDVERLSIASDKTRQTTVAFRDDIFQELSHHRDSLAKSFDARQCQVDDRLNKVEELLQAQSQWMQASQVQQIGPLYNTLAPPLRRQSTRRLSSNSAQVMKARMETVGVRLRQYKSGCSAGCPCSCHVRRASNSPLFLDRVLGQLFVGYSGMPMFSARCDTGTCTKSQMPTVDLEYWFPAGFCWSQIFRLRLAYEKNIGPSFQLSSLRRVADAAPCINFALEGNIEGLKCLFSQGLASPRDVSTTRGYSLLRWALYGQQYETCKFLVTAGADPSYAPIAPSDNCPSDKAWDIILRGGLDQNVTDILKIIAEGTDYVENQNFARLHEIVLGLVSDDVEQEISKSPSHVDIPDASGRTALEWAAARGDERAVVTLLSYGADPNNMDAKLNTPLTLAANQNHTVCTRLLLEAGALPDPVLPKGVKFGTPLSCAARNAPDPLLLKTLLDFNANVEASGVDHVTPLIHVARGNSASHAMILLEYGAAINATSTSGQTPLTAAISHNNHGVLQLLLEHWFQYNECPRLKGPHLLEHVARYANEKTISILSAAEHLRIKRDESYLLSEYLEILQTRTDTSEKLVAAFEDLLSILAMGPNTHVESKMECGYARPWDCPYNTAADYDNDDTDSEQAYEDALENY